MTIKVLGNNIADLAETGGGRNADVLAQVMKALEYPQTHACIKRLRLARPLQCFVAAGGHGSGFIINLVLCEQCGRRKRGRDQE
jgi:hypothetical protein